MNKSVYLSLTILSIVILVGCMSSEELALKKYYRCKSVKEIEKDGCTETIITFRNYKRKDYINKEIEIYEAKEWLYPILDSIIVKTEECPMYQGLKSKIAFSFYISPDSIGFSITADYAPQFLNHAKWTDAIFYYKRYDFYCGEIFSDSFFRKTGEKRSITCIAPEKYQFELHFRGDQDMFWTYEYKNGQVTNIGYGYCCKTN